MLRTRDGVIVAPSDLSHTPGWAKPIVAAAIKVDARKRNQGKPR